MTETEKIIPDVPEDLVDIVTKEIESPIYISDTLKRAKEVDYSEMAEVIGGIESYQRKQTAVGVYAMLEAVMMEMPPVTNELLRQMDQELDDGEAQELDGEDYFVNNMIDRLKDDNPFVKKFIEDRVSNHYEKLLSDQSAINAYYEMKTALIIYRLIEAAEEEKLKTGSGGYVN